MDTIHRFVFEHRRMLAAACTGLAVLAALSAMSSPPGGSPVVVASRDLPSGTVISAADLREARLPASARPDHTLDRADVVGRQVAGPMRKGEALTDYRVLRPDALAGYGAGDVLTSVRVDAVDGATGIRVGDRVDVVAVDPGRERKAEIVARDVEVVTLPSRDEDSQAVAIGIVTTEDAALALAEAALESRFSLISVAS